MNLPALQDSPFLQSLGWAIANSLWQSAALWISYHLVMGIYRGASAKFKNNFCTLLLSSAFIWFCFTLFSKYFFIQNLSENYIQFYGENNIIAVTKYNWNEIIDNITAVLPYLSVAYLLLLIFLSLRLINVYRSTRFIKFNGLQKPQAEWRIFTEKAARHLGITKNIKLWVSHHIDVPATIGYLKPIILIPLASINQLSPDQLEAIILHELSHIKRNDYLVNLFISIVETILFFNPFVVLLAQIIKRERENCCDDFVIQYQYDRHTYASALLSLEQCRNTSFRLAISATSGKKQLLQRIKRIMEVNSNPDFNYGQKLAALLLITSIIYSIAWLSPQNKRNIIHTKLKKTVEQQTITFDKNYAGKQTKEVKAFLIGLKRNINNVKILPVKTTTKSQFTFINGDVKEQNRTLGASSTIESTQEFNPSKDKSDQNSKSIEKYNAAKLLNTKRSTHTTSIINNGKEVFLFESDLANAYVNYQQKFFDLQKMQSELDRIKFSFSFDDDKMQDEGKGSVNPQQLEKRRMLNHAGIEKLIRVEIKKLANRNAANAQTFQPKQRVSIISNSGILCIIDSLSDKLFKSFNKHLSQYEKRANNTMYSGENSIIAGPSPHASSYSYYNTPLTEENKTNENSVKVFSRKNGENRQQVWGVNIKPRFAFRAIPKLDNHSKANAPKSSPLSKIDKLRIEYKKGVIVINGEKIDLPNVKELLAQLSVKNKKQTGADKDFDLQINY